MDTLNKRIKAIRKARGLTQMQMASKLGITQSGYQQIETGNSDSMRVSTLRNLCIEFGLSADDLLGLNARLEGNAYEMVVLPTTDIKEIAVKGVLLPGVKQQRKKSAAKKKAEAK